MKATEEERMYDHNNESLYLNGTVWTLAELWDGQIEQPYPAGAVTYQGFHSHIIATAFNPSTAAVITGPLTLDSKLRDCSLPRMLKATSTAAFGFWKEHSTSGDQIMVTYYNGTSWATPVSISGTTYYPDIREYSVACDNSGNAAVMIRSHAGSSDDRIWTQCISSSLTTVWTGTAYTPMRQISGPLTTPLVAASAKYNPVVVWNNVKTRFEYAWGDHYYNPGADIIFFQTEDMPWSAPTENYAQGGYPENPMTLYRDPDALGMHAEYFGNMKFCMLPCKGRFLPPSGPDQGMTFLSYCDANGDVQMAGVYLNGGTVPILVAQTLFTSPGRREPGFPSTIAAYTVSSTVEDPVFFVHPYFYAEVLASRVSIGSGGFVWTPGVIHTWPTYSNGSEMYEDYAAVNSNGIYLVTSDNQQETVLRYDPGTGAFTVAGSSAALTRIPVSGTLDAYFSAAFGPSTLSIFNFDFGYDLGTTGPTPRNWLLSFSYLGLTGSGSPIVHNPETDEPMRENGYIPTAYNFHAFSTTSTSPYLSHLADHDLTSPIIHHSPSTAVYDNQRVTAYENYDWNGISDIMLAVNSNTTPVNITSATGGDSYYQPKVGLSYSALYAAYIAVITYVKESAGGSSAIWYSELNLSTGVYTTPTQVSPSTATFDHRNWAVVRDQSLNCNLFVYGEGYKTTGSVSNLYAFGFDYDGAPLPWGIQNITNNFSDYQDEVRACYNPDPSATGMYVTWRSTLLPAFGIATPGDGAKIGLVAVRSFTGLPWAIGSYYHVPANTAHRGEPVVAATANWVYVAWADQQAGSQEIFGAAHDNAGVLLPGSFMNGTLTNVPFIWQNPTLVQAKQPDVVASPVDPYRVILAFETDDNPLNNDPTKWRVIAIGNVTVNPYTSLTTTSGVSNEQITMQMGGRTFPAGFTSTDADNTLYGFAQRRPKLSIATNAIEGIKYSNIAPIQIMLAFETEAYPISTLTSPYSDIWTSEVAHRSSSPNGQPEWCENNIAARLINPALGARLSGSPLVLANFNLARNTNPQDLISLNYSDSQGFSATLLDYVSTSGFNGVAKTVDIKPDIMYSPNANSIPPLVGTQWPKGLSTLNTRDPIVYNTSWVPLTIYPDVMSTTITSPDYWAVPTSVLVPPRSTAQIPITYSSGVKSPPNDLKLVAYGDLVAAISGVILQCYDDQSQAMSDGSAGAKMANGSNSRSQGVWLSQTVTSSRTSLHLTGDLRATGVRILNVLGQVVASYPEDATVSPERIFNLDLSSQPAGSYFVQVVWQHEVTLPLKIQR
jgi:hypothetical protein